MAREGGVHCARAPAPFQCARSWQPNPLRGVGLASRKAAIEIVQVLDTGFQRRHITAVAQHIVCRRQSRLTIALGSEHALGHVGVDPADLEADSAALSEVRNRGPAIAMPPSIEARLRAMFADEYSRLESMLGRLPDAWHRHAPAPGARNDSPR